MTTIATVRIKFNMPRVAADLGYYPDAHDLFSETVSTIARRLEQGDTAGDIRNQFYDDELDAWDSYEAATFDVVGEDGNPIINLAEVVE